MTYVGIEYEKKVQVLAMSKDCCSSQPTECNVKVTVEVSKIVKYLCIAGVLIVGIIFGTKTFLSMLESGFIKVEE